MCESCFYASPLGKILLSAGEDGLRGIWFEDQRYCGSPDRINDRNPILMKAKTWLDAYFRGECPDVGGIPLAPTGTAFQKRVWTALLCIPQGSTVTYGALAKRMGSSPRAVGGAVGRNPISILIPCHRVVGATGLTGYAGGLDRKVFLLDLEQKS